MIFLIFLFAVPCCTLYGMLPDLTVRPKQHAALREAGRKQLAPDREKVLKELGDKPAPTMYRAWAHEAWRALGMPEDEMALYVVNEADEACKDPTREDASAFANSLGIFLFRHHFRAAPEWCQKAMVGHEAAHVFFADYHETKLFLERQRARENRVTLGLYLGMVLPGASFLTYQLSNRNLLVFALCAVGVAGSSWCAADYFARRYYKYAYTRFQQQQEARAEIAGVLATDTLDEMFAHCKKQVLSNYALSKKTDGIHLSIADEAKLLKLLIDKRDRKESS